MDNQDIPSSSHLGLEEFVEVADVLYYSVSSPIIFLHCVKTQGVLVIRRYNRSGFVSLLNLGLDHLLLCSIVVHGGDLQGAIGILRFNLHNRWVPTNDYGLGVDHKQVDVSRHEYRSTRLY